MKPSTAAYVFITACSLAMAACQPVEGPTERAAKSLDNNAKAFDNHLVDASGNIRIASDDSKQ